MTKFKWFYLMLCLNFGASISIIPLSEWMIDGKLKFMPEFIPAPTIVLIWYVLMVVTIGVIIIMGVCHLKLAYSLYKKDESKQLRRGMLYMKVGTIPFFLLNFVYFAFVTVFPLILPMGFIFLAPEILVMIFAGTMTYIIMLCTSVYGMGYLALLKKEEKISLTRLVVNLILQVIFVLDILDTIYLLIKYRKK